MHTDHDRPAATSLFQQATESATNQMQSGAYARMLQGMMKT